MAHDRWSAGDPYETYVGRWSRLVAPRFVSWLGLAPGSRFADVGCGTGALTAALPSPSAAVGVDRSPAFLAAARRRVPAARFLLGDACALPLASDTFDAVVSGLVINFVRSPQTMIGELARIARPGAAVAAYVWDYADGMQLMRHFWDAATSLDPAASSSDVSCSPAWLAGLWRSASLSEVAVGSITVDTHFASFEDYWNPFLGGQGTAPAYVASLSADHRSALRALLRSRLPTDPDGSIHLTAGAITIRGVR